MEKEEKKISQNMQFWVRNGLKFLADKSWLFGLSDSLLMGVKISSSILLCILGDLAGGGPVAVAVGVSVM